MSPLSSPRRPYVVTRWIARVIWPRRKKAQTTYDLIRLENMLRLSLLYVATVFGPGFLLAWLGITGSRGGDLALLEEVEREAVSSVESALQRTESVFDQFEAAARSRVERGMSPTDSLLELSPYLLLAVRLDASGQIESPFRVPEAEPPLDRSFFFTGPYADARKLEENEQDYAKAAALYEVAASRVRGMALQGSARLQVARMKAKLGQPREAEDLYADIVADYSTFRDPWGFPLGEVARLKRGEILLQREPLIGVPALTSVVEDILGQRWEVGRGGEAAIARRALVLLEGVAETDAVASLRNRLDERSSQLYWAERLLPELRDSFGGGVNLKVAPGKFRYKVGKRALWATVWFREDLYAFAMDLDTLREAMARFARYAARPDGHVLVSMVRSDQQAFSQVLARRSLAPWFAGWSLVGHPRNATELRNSMSSRRTRRLAMVASSILLILVGSVMSVRLVRRELELAELKTTFAASVSHELRSPITQIRLKGESLQLGLAADEADRQRHYDAIVREAERLSRLVDNVLDFAAIERGTKQYHLRPMDLGESLRHAVEAMRFSMESRGMTLEADIPEDMPVIHHDPDAVAQVVTNLLSNASKYGGGWARLSATQFPDGVQVDIQDRGIGIDPSEVERIFEQFYRSQDPRARRTKGTGIGLAVVKYIMEAHGGKVSVNSRPGQGSVFQLFFPFAPPERPGGTDAAHPVRRGRGRGPENA